MQQKNLITFILLATIIVIGGSLLQNWIWPPPSKPKRVETPVVLLPESRLWTTLPAQVSALFQQTAAVSGIGNACGLATDLVIANWSAGERPVEIAQKKPEAVLKEAEPDPQVKVERREIVLGEEAEDSPFNLKVVFTTQGGGIKSVVLNKFKQANYYGKPAGNPPPPLSLVPPDPFDHPSNLLYHYAQAEIEGHPDHPLDTLGKRDWKVASEKNNASDEEHQIAFVTTIPSLDVTITKTYTLARRTYHVGLTVQIERSKASAKPLLFRYQLTGAHGLPIDGEWYTTIYRNAVMGLKDTKNRIWRTLLDSRTIGFQDGSTDVAKSDDKFIRYAGIATQYFASVVVVDDQQVDGIKQSFLSWARATVESEPNTKKQFLDDINVRLVSEAIELKPGVPVVHKYLLYNGPVKVRLLTHLDGDKAVPEDLVNRYESDTRLGLNTLTDVGNWGFWTNLLISCTNLVHGLLWYLHRYVMPWSYGLTIILVTIIVRGIMFPVSRKQAAGQVKMQEKMQEMAPELKKLEEKYKNDRAALNQAKQEMYLRKGVNPLTMMGSCWILFAQMPVFLGLYYALQESIHFRLAPFLWMDNLAAPDMLIWWGENIPIISRPEDQGGFLYLGPYFNLLPIIWVALTIIQQKMLTPPATDDQQAMQQKMMKYMMVFFGLMFYKVPAGLCIYFIASSLWSLAERKLLPKRKPAAMTELPADRNGGPGPSRKRKLRNEKSNGDSSLQGKVKNWWSVILKEARKK